MKIERISDEQIKFILNKEDLNIHNLKVTDLAQGSEKMHSLFREMMTQAMLEFDFNADANTPLIVETVPLPNDCIMIVVTKAAAQEYLESKFNLSPRAKDERKYKRKPFIETPAQDGADTSVSIFMFKTLDEAGEAASRLHGGFTGESCLYKNQNKYYLVLHNDDKRKKMDFIESVLMEYGQKYSASAIYELHLDEYGEVIVTTPAIDKLAGIYGGKY